MATQISTHPLMFDELLDKINDSSDVVSALKQAFKQSYVRGYIELAVSDNFPLFALEDVAFKQYDYHRSMAGAFMLNRQTWNIIYNVIMGSESVAETTKNKQYKALMEMLYVGESNALDAIFKKDLESVYPNITFAKMNEALNAG